MPDETKPTSAAMPRDKDVVAIDQLRDTYGALCSELGKVIIGQDQVIEELVIAILGRGHALLMGVPGLAKTLLVRSIAETLALTFSRIQFTPPRSSRNPRRPVAGSSSL